MRTQMKIAIAAAAALVLAGGLAQPTLATCVATTPGVQTVNALGYISHVWTQDWFYGGDFSAVPPFAGFNNGVTYFFSIEPAALLPGAGNTLTAVSPNYRGFWWVLGFGDDSGNLGSRGGPGSSPANTDSGVFNFPIKQRPAGYNAGLGQTLNFAGYFDDGWHSSVNIDGCPIEDLEGNQADLLNNGECVCVLLTDQYNGKGYFAMTSNAMQPTGFTILTQPTRTGFIAGTGGNTGTASTTRDPIILRPIPRARITGAVTASNTQVDVTVQTPALSNGLYNLGGCQCNPTGFIVHQRNFANATLNDQLPDAEPNGERDIAAGSWNAVSSLTALGGSTVVNATCSGDQSIFLASQLCFANGGAGDICTPVVGESAVEVECGANLATDPAGPGRGKGKGLGNAPGQNKN